MDFRLSYLELLEAYQRHGRAGEIKEPLCRAADELYYFLRYGNALPEPGNSRLEGLQIGPQYPCAALELHPTNVGVLTDPDALRTLLEGDDPKPESCFATGRTA